MMMPGPLFDIAAHVGALAAFIIGLRWTRSESA